MDANVVALFVAVVGMLGTLTSPVIGQRLAARSRVEERESQRHDALEAREQAWSEALLREKKGAYITFNSAARRYRAQLMTYLHAVHEKTLDETDRAELAETRGVYLSALAEVQIMAPDEVAVSVEAVMSHLSSAYDAIKALERGKPKPGSSFEEIRDGLMAVWDLWHTMRRIIRVDLGLEPAGPAAPPATTASLEPAVVLEPTALPGPATPSVTPAGERSPNA
ncbi:hypothetical protein [Streptacidiphilus jiangxiensis]|uniref:Uncharacterized protein n=1 Tax=Streptacidiphilus jiangxiensis TaxID=235985 RepID=A0A1H7MA99_STRJI|nr:hypothetical protein [Streptacidiphilus jiangxiensis]SEL08051.1 hypothetical protein SAMN05414137_105264 [Streptacidiphilus jiangxiensis]